MRDYSFSAKGNRGNNEDYILSSHLSANCSVHLVADGIGGSEFGEIASFLACQTIVGFLESQCSIQDIEILIQKAVQLANEKIRMKSFELSEKLGTAIAGVLINDKTAYSFGLGDVRFYHFRNKEIIYQSEDDSYINEIRKRRPVSMQEIKRYSHIITKSLTGNPLPAFEIRLNQLQSEDRLMLCTDGFWRNFEISLYGHIELENISIPIDDKIDDNYSVLITDIT